MKEVIVSVGDKKYKVVVANDTKSRVLGLKGKESLPEDGGMLFVWERPQNISMTMEDTLIPLDLIFINDDFEVTKVAHREDVEKDELVGKSNTTMVLEVNINSGIKEGDQFDIEDDEKLPAMKVLAPDGSTLMELEGGERIVSRRETRILIRKAKLIYQLEKDSEEYNKLCKSLGKYMFKVLKGLDTREPEYVQAPK